MHIFLCCSKHFYNKIPPIKEELEKNGHAITLPNCYNDPLLEERIKAEGQGNHSAFKAQMFREQEEKIRSNDAILVLNYDKNGQQNYIGGAVFLEIFKAWELRKKIYMYNPLPNNIFTDELNGMNPTVVYGELSKIK